MSAAIHLNIIAAFDRWTQGDSPPRELLTKALPFVNESVEAARGLRLYHLNEHALLAGASTDDAPRQFILIEDGTVHTQVLAQRQPIFGDGAWWIPLNTESSTFGLLEVMMDTAVTPAPDTAEWLSLIGMYIAQALEARELHSLNRKQAAASSQLTHAASFRDIAFTMAKTLLGPGQYIGINLFQFADTGQITGFKVIASANRHQAFEGEVQVDEETVLGFGETFKQLMESSNPVFVADVETSSVITRRALQWLQRYQITAYCSIPMRSRGKTIGFISINDTHGTLYLSKTYLTVYQSLTDQISTLVELGRLAETADYAYEISERQKAAFDEMVAGLDYPEMAAIIARHMLPESGRYLGINELIYDQDNQPKKWVIRASANRNKSYQWTQEFPIKWEDLSEAFRLSLLNNEPYIIPDTRMVDRRDFGETFHVWIEENKVSALASIPIFMNAFPLAALVIISNRPTTFTREEINAFSALSGQMGALIQVRQLLEQARAARIIVDNFALANRLVANSEDFPGMAKAMMASVAQHMSAAGITLYDKPLAADERPQYRRFVGMSTTEKLLPTNPDEKLFDLPDDTQLGYLRAGIPVVLNVDDADAAMSARSREILAPYGIQWIARFGLRAGGFLLGTLNIYSSTLYNLSQEEIDGYVTLADQIGVTIRSRQLFQESQLAQVMASQLVQVNHLISVAEDYSEMAGAIASFAPENIDAIGILLFSEPVTYRELPRFIKTEVIVTGNQITNRDINAPVDATNNVLQQWLERLHQGDMILVEDSRQVEDGVQIIAQYLTARDMFTFTAVGLRVGVRMVGVLVFGAKTAEAFSGLQLDTLRVIAGQVAVSIENRNLINQTADALSFVAEQYEMSNALFRAVTPLDILTIIYRFTNGQYASAMLEFEQNNEKLYRVAQIKNGVGEQASNAKPLAVRTMAELPLYEDDNLIYSDDRTSLTFLLLTATSRLIGVITLNSETPVDLPLNRVRALRTLVDQVTISLENRFLLEQTETALRETRILYDVNRALLAAENGLGVLEIVRDHISPDAYGLSLANLTYDLMGVKTDTYTIESLVTPEKSENVKLPLHNNMGGAVMANFNIRWSRLGSNIDFIQDVEGADALGAVANPGLLYLKQQGVRVRSAIVIPIFDEDKMRQQLNITFSEPRVFDVRTRRLFEVLRDQINIVLQNQRLLRDMEHSTAQLGNQVRLLQILNQLASTLSLIDNETDLTNEVAQSLVSALRVDHVGITLLDKDGEGSTVVSEHPTTGAVGFKIARDNPLMRQILEDHAPMLIRDVEGESGLSETNRQLLKTLGIKAMLFLPLLDVQNRYLGAIGFDAYTDVNAFTPEVVETGRAIAAQLAVSLQNVRQLANTRHQAEQLQKLARLGQSIQSKLDVPSIIDTVLTNIGGLMAVEKARFLLYEPLNRRLAVVALYSDDELTVVNDNIVLDDTSVAGRAWRRRELVHIPELEIEKDLVSLLDRGSVLAMPIFSRGAVLGLIEAAHPQIFVYNETDLLIFQQIVNQIGVAIENADAYTQSQRIARSKALINEIGTQLQQQLDLDSVLSVTAQELGRALNARRARIRLGTEMNPRETE